MKLHTIALASLAVIGSQSAFAERINMTGASALRGVIANTIWYEACNGATNKVGFNLTGPDVAGGTLVPSANFWAIRCTTAQAFGTFPAGTLLEFYKSDQGGSGQGVYPVIQGANKPQVSAVPASCTTGPIAVLGGGTVYRVCANEAAPAKIHFGVSDLEPAIFAGVNKPTDDPTYDESLLLNNDLNVAPVVQTVFGVAVNSRLYDALFTAQKAAGILPAVCALPTDGEHCVPSIGKAQATSIFAGLASGWGTLSPGLASPTNQLNVCRRAPGSGTQAAANRQLLEFPANTNALAPADFTFSDPAVPQLDPLASAATITQYIETYVLNAANRSFFFEGPGSGNVIACLTRASTVGGYAIGHLSKENGGNQSLGGTTWAHIRLDGKAPGRENAKSGRYDYVFESTVQYSAATFAALSANQQAFITSFRSRVGTPESLRFIGSPADDGVASLPNPGIAFNTGTPDQIKFYSRVTRGGNSNTPLTLGQ